MYTINNVFDRSIFLFIYLGVFGYDEKSAWQHLKTKLHYFTTYMKWYRAASWLSHAQIVIYAGMYNVVWE